MKGPDSQLLVSDDGVRIAIKPADTREARSRALDQGMRFPVVVDVEAPPLAEEKIARVRQAVMKQLTLKHS